MHLIVSYLRHLFEYIGTQFPPTFQFTVREDGFDYIVFFFFQMGY